MVSHAEISFLTGASISQFRNQNTLNEVQHRFIYREEKK